MPRVQPQQRSRAAPSPTPEPSRKVAAQSVIKDTLVTLEKAVDELAVPGLKAAAKSVLEIIGIACKAKRGTDGLFELCICLYQLKNAIITPLLNQPYPGIPPASRAPLDRLASELNQLSGDWHKLRMPQSILFSLINSEDYGLAIDDVNRRIKASIDAFLLDRQVFGAAVTESTRRSGECMERHFLSKEVQALPYTDASFDSMSRSNAPVCFESTRAAVLDDILGWIIGDGHRIYILSGVAGVGKTTIAQTISTLVAKVSCLSASFFFSRDEDGRNSLRVFFPTLAFQLAQSSEEFEIRISKVLKQWPDAPRKTPREQLKKLIVEPLHGISMQHGQPILMVLDALDECGADGGSEVLRLLVDFIPQLPTNPKLFVTMRPDPQFLPILNASIGRKQMVLHDIEEMIVQEDIRHYLRHQLSHQEVEKVIYGCNWQIREEDLETLVQAAGRLFIVASTAEKFIKDTIQCDPQHQLDILLGADEQNGLDLSPHVSLDRLYSQILQNAVPSSHSSVNIVRRFQTVIGSIIVLQHPLPLPSLARLLNEKLPVCEAALRPLHSVIVSSIYDQSPRVYHPSFPDFITDHCRCRDERFLIKSPIHHTRLAVQCLDVMDRLLRRNICNLPVPDRYMKNNEIPDLTAKVKRYIPDELEYACTYWAVHLNKAASSDEAMMKLETFAMKHLLSWLEVLSLTGRLDHAYPTLVDLQRFSISNHVAAEVLTILNDAQRSLLGSYEIIKMSAMHIYYSALPFAPVESTLFRLYEYEGSESIEVVKGRDKTWNPLLAVLIGHSNAVNHVAFSPSGTRLISGSDDNTLRLWDGVTGAVIAKMKGHLRKVTSVVFSPDGSRLASGSLDRTVRLWDGVTGAVVAELEGHSAMVNSVVFSPNGAFLASASCDDTVRLWGGVIGNVVAELKGHSDLVSSVMFSPDGTRLASSSDDKTVRLWDRATGSVIAELRGHSSRVNSVVFSPGGTRLASASDDKTVRLWDVATGEVVAELEGHSGRVRSVEFSPDGARLASSSWDNTMRLWDGVTGAVVGRLDGHSDMVRSVVFSFDGTRLASSSWDKTVRLWDGVTGAVIAELEGHSDRVDSVVFSPDGARLASASWDNTVCIWDALVGTVVEKSEGRLCSITSVALSPNGTRLASASMDKIVRLWDVVTGAIVAELEGHSSSVNSVVFTPNGSRLVSASEDGTVRLWDGVTGIAVAELQGHSDNVRLVVPSPNGTRLASVSDDKTVRLWDAVTGGVVAELEAHSHEVNSAVFSPDGSRLASASRDGSMWLWNAVTGEVAASLEGHSRSVNSLVFSPDGTRLVSVSWDKFHGLWNGATGGMIAQLEGHSQPVHSIVFSPDGTRIASVYLDNAVRVWNGATGTLIIEHTSKRVGRTFQLVGELATLHRPVSYAQFIMHERKAGNQNASPSPPLRIESVLFEFDSKAQCYVLLGLREQADQTFSETRLCWFPRSLPKGIITQDGTSIVVGLEDGRVFIFSTARLRLA